jgi:cytochrome c556
MVLLVGGLIAAACSPAPAPPAAEVPAPAPAAAPAPPAYKPVVSLNQMMVSIVDMNSHQIWDAEEKPPKAAADWANLEHAAESLAAAGHLTMVSGNGPKDQQWTNQADWAKYSEAVSQAGLKALEAVNTKSPDGLRKAGDDLVMTCINCHREYKLDVPKIWSDHESHVPK